MIAKRELAIRVRAVLADPNTTPPPATIPSIARELLSECAIVLELQNESEDLMMMIVERIVPVLAARISPPPDPPYPDESTLLFKAWIRSLTEAQVKDLKMHLTEEQFNALKDARNEVLAEDR